MISALICKLGYISVYSAASAVPAKTSTKFCPYFWTSVSVLTKSNRTELSRNIICKSTNNLRVVKVGVASHLCFYSVICLDCVVFRRRSRPQLPHCVSSYFPVRLKPLLSGELQAQTTNPRSVTVLSFFLHFHLKKNNSQIRRWS